MILMESDPIIQREAGAEDRLRRLPCRLCPGVPDRRGLLVRLDGAVDDVP